MLNALSVAGHLRNDDSLSHGVSVSRESQPFPARKLITDSALNQRCRPGLRLRGDSRDPRVSRRPRDVARAGRYFARD